MPKQKLTRAQRTALAAERAAAAEQKQEQRTVSAASSTSSASAARVDTGKNDDRGLLSLSFDESMDDGAGAANSNNREHTTSLRELNAGHPLTLVPLDVWSVFVFSRVGWASRRSAARACRALHRAAMGSLRSVRLLPTASVAAIKALLMLPLLESLDADGHKDLYGAVDLLSTNLTALSLQACRLEQRHIVDIATRLTRLRMLDLSGVSRAARPEALAAVATMPQLHELRLSRCLLTVDSFVELLAMTALRSIELLDLPDAIAQAPELPRTLAAMTALESINFGPRVLPDSGFYKSEPYLFTRLSSLTSLRLQLSRPPVDCVRNTFSKCQRLQQLTLTAVEVSDPSDFEMLPVSLRVLELDVAKNLPDMLVLSHLTRLQVCGPVSVPRRTKPTAPNTETLLPSDLPYSSRCCRSLTGIVLVLRVYSNHSSILHH